MKLPSDFKQKMYVCISTDPWNAGEVIVLTFDPSMSDGYILVGTIEAEFDLSSFDSDVTDKRVELLESKKVKILARAHMKVKEIDEQIQSLKAIENK